MKKCWKKSYHTFLNKVLSSVSKEDVQMCYLNTFKIWLEEGET